ncbi:MAG TPA: hypothetical protein VN911_13420 [Candidatus Acidoferrum sp.]|nr:hypothetical protein [Candidatus Acidoferrum sp.]
MKMTVRAAMLLGLTVALFQDSLAYGQTAVASTFQVVPTPNQNFNSELLAASASSPNDIWAVGQSTIHFDGATWTAFPAPMIKGDNNSFLQGVVDISPTLAWAAGNVTDGAHPGQVIEQWNGSKWSLFPGPKFGKKDQADVFAMTASSANDVWAIGSLVNLGTGDVSPLFEHWNGTAWTATTGESNNQFLFGASADTANDAWAVGFNGSDNIETLAMHWDGANWKGVATPNVGEGTNKLNAVLALAPNDVWAVGFSTPLAPPRSAATLTLIEHFDGTSWAVIPSPNVGPNGANQSNRLFGLTANSPNDIWAFGSYFPSDESGHQMTLLLHWDGTSWTVASSPSPTKGGFPCDLLWAGVAPSPGNVWILGAGHDETLALHMTTGGNSGLVSSFSTGPLTR